MPPALEATNLWRLYGRVPAVQGLDLTVERGSAYWFIGPNGAGKSSTLRLLATAERPDAGRIRVDGVDAERSPRAARRLLGFMPDPVELDPELTVVEALELHARVHEVARPRHMVERALELTRLHEHRRKRADQLSKGWQQRALLARTLVHDPLVLLLDEPASGLDPAARIELREVVRALRDLGKAVVISSHILAELADMCDSVGIIERGRMLVSGRIDEITARLTPARVLDVDVLGPLEPALAAARAAPGVAAARARSTPPADGALPGRLELELAPVGRPGAAAAADGVEVARAAAAVVRHLVEAGVAVCGVAPRAAGLEDLYLRVSASLGGRRKAELPDAGRLRALVGAAEDEAVAP